MAVSNTITAILNFTAVLCSIAVIGAGIWLNDECIHRLRWPVILLGLAFLAVSLSGFVGAYWKKETLLAIYLISMFVLIVLLLALLVLAFVVTRPSGAYSVPGVGFEEYRLEGFSSWLRDRVAGGDNWAANIKPCLESTQICYRLNRRPYISAADFFAAHLSPIESGCCKPPLTCGFQYSSPTTWVVGPTSSTSAADCSVWENDPTRLCYGCDSCRAGFLADLRSRWSKAAVVLIVTLTVLIWVYLVACSAFRNAQTESLFRSYKRGWV
ncbi:hypothetical protein M569_12516 [Genlisea aurea]|uniref:Tetraspanin-2 n=1 Tax=Genlisea aurea TaxID=192259 RepID=S8C689_9LAMI|nr:hypothetical protein M569_12516 [Genlisea aurea]